jgi:hypothetical protein
MKILEKVKSLNLPDKQFVVMGGAVLELKGIRKSSDIDIIVTKELFETLKKDSDWEYKSEIGSLGNVMVESLENHKGISLYSHIYGAGDIDFFRNDPDKIEEIEGIYFVSLSNLLEVKSSSWNREKDKKDVELIRDYLSRRN